MRIFRIFILAVLFLLLSLAFTSNSQSSKISDHSISLKTISPDAILMFESVIAPWIENEFQKDISDSLIEIDRKLLFKELYRYEVIDGQHRYSVHIEFAVRIKDKTSKSDYMFAVVKGQEIVFLVEDKKIKDFFPFEEYTFEEAKI